MRGPAISLPQSTVGGGDLCPAWGQGARGVSRGGPAASVSPLLSLCLAGVSRGSRVWSQGLACCSASPASCPFLQVSSPECPCPVPAEPCAGAPGSQGAPSRLCSLFQPPRAGASPAPLTWDLTAARSDPSSPPAPPGPPLPPEAFLAPAPAAPHRWSPRNRLPWGHRPRGNAGPGGTFSSFRRGDTWNSSFPWIRPRGGLRAGPDTSRGQVVRRALRGKGREPRNQPGKGSCEDSGAWGQAVSAGPFWRQCLAGRLLPGARARLRGAHAGLPSLRGQDAEPPASLPCRAGRAVRRVSWGQGSQQRPQSPAFLTCSCMQEGKEWVTCGGGVPAE